MTRFGNLLYAYCTLLTCSCYLSPTAVPFVVKFLYGHKIILLFPCQTLQIAWELTYMSVTSPSLLWLRYSLNNWTQAPKYYIDIEIQGFLEFFYQIRPRYWQFIVSPRCLRVSGILLGAYGQYQRNLIPRSLSIYRASLCACALCTGRKCWYWV